MKNKKKIKVSNLTTILIVTINGVISMKTIKNLYNHYKIIIVENNKNENLKKKLIDRYKKIQIEIPNKNLGFGGGNNFGLKKIKTKYALILNPDVEITKKSVDMFEIYSKQIKNFSILTANVKDFNLMMKSRLDKLDKLNDFKILNRDLNKIPWVPEWCMFCKVKDLKKINYFDENFFLYFDGLDLCKRLKINNKNFYMINKINIIHHMAGTSSNLEKKHELDHWKLRFWHFYWSSFYYHRKHYGYYNSLFIHIGKLFRFFFKKNYLYFFKKNEHDYITTKAKFHGILNQILNKKSYFRIKL
jgi:N-acetylglucosaminyl-diphospho-decaprenol L-rhamnosyltransferase